MKKNNRSYRPFSKNKLKLFLDEMDSMFDSPHLTDEVVALRNLAEKFKKLSEKCERRADKIELPFKSFVAELGIWNELDNSDREPEEGRSDTD
jgi:hypothetical protein